MSENVSQRQYPRCDGQLVISIDFGSVKSSICWALLPGGVAALPNTVHTIIFEDGLTEVSSQMAYDKSIQDWVWGPDLVCRTKTLDNPKGTVLPEDIITMPKLCLDVTENEDVRKDVKKQLKRVGSLRDSKTGLMKVPTYQVVCREFLHRLHRCAKTAIQTYNQWPHEEKDIKCIVSFPAVWKWQTCNEVANLARDAGLTNVEAVSEQESSAAYIIRHNTRTNSILVPNSPWGSPRLFVIIDAGGGTVDLNSYEVPSYDPMLVIHEGGKSFGGYLGSAILNKRFEKEVRELFATDIQKIIDYSQKHDLPLVSVEDVVRKTVEKFEKFKQRFDGRRDLRAKIFLTRNEEGVLVIPSAVIVRLFDEIIKDIAKCTEDLLQDFHTDADNVAKKIKDAIIVGGFSRNNFLFKRLKDTLRGSQYGVTLFRHDEGSSSSSGLVVSEGAVYMSVFKSIFGKRSFRQSLGICQDEEFNPDPNIHGSYRTTTIGVDGHKWALNCFVPLWREGDKFHGTYVNVRRGWMPIKKRPLRVLQRLYGGDGVKAHLNVNNSKNGIKSIGSIDTEIPDSEVDEAFWTNKAYNVCYFEYAVRSTVNYPTITFEYIIPRKGVFSNPLSKDPLSPEELNNDVYVREATLEAAGTINVAMEPHVNRQTRGRLPGSTTAELEHSLMNVATPLRSEFSSSSARAQSSREERQSSWSSLSEQPEPSSRPIRPTVNANAKAGLAKSLSPLVENATNTAKRGTPNRSDLIPQKKPRLLSELANTEVPRDSAVHAQLAVSAPVTTSRRKSSKSAFHHNYQRKYRVASTSGIDGPLHETAGHLNVAMRPCDDMRAETTRELSSLSRQEGATGADTASANTTVKSESDEIPFTRPRDSLCSSCEIGAYIFDPELNRFRCRTCSSVPYAETI